MSNWASSLNKVFIIIINVYDANLALAWLLHRHISGKMLEFFWIHTEFAHF